MAEHVQESRHCISYDSNGREASSKQESIQIEEVPLTKTQPPKCFHESKSHRHSSSPSSRLCLFRLGPVYSSWLGCVSCFVGLLVPAQFFPTVSKGARASSFQLRTCPQRRCCPPLQHNVFGPLPHRLHMYGFLLFKKQ